MRKDTTLKPDEIMYNSLLDGCAQNNQVDEGLRLLEEMKSAGVPPSNFSLSILVKMMSRAHRLEEAFALVADITKQYRFKPNVHVYTNLVQACVTNQQLNRGMKILDQMAEERIVPESRTYALLIRGNMSKGLFDQAVCLLKGALGLLGAPGSFQVCPNLDAAVVNETLCGLADRGRAQDLVVPLHTLIRQSAPKVRIDAATQRKIMSPDAAAGDSFKGKGKGKGGNRR